MNESIKGIENPIDLNRYELYENRELTWLEFNQRVLWEAENNENPLFERLKFLSIVSSNLDEFFMVRVASIKEQIHVGYDKRDYSGLLPSEQLEAIAKRTHIMVEDQSHILKRMIFPGLKKNSIYIAQSLSELDEQQNEYLREYFDTTLYPVLTPMAVDSSRPFPLILNKSLNIGTFISKDGEEYFATVQVPAGISRYIGIPAKLEGGREFVLLEEVIKANIHKLFAGYEVICSYAYRITRNADLSIDEEEAEDLLLEIEKSIKQRKWGEAIRLEVEKSMGEGMRDYLSYALRVHEDDVYRIDGPLDLTFLMKFYGLKDTKELKYVEFQPTLPEALIGEENIFEAIKKRDIFMHHPFEAFDPVIDLITYAAKDPKVLAIKQTLYRVSGRSPIISALAEAAEAGKQVTVLVELKARFDEENNIQWARRLEKAGCHVIYGLVGLKTHSKVTLIVRNEDEGIRRYVHLGTGNYNDITAKFYTDMGLLTVNEKIGSDVSAVFNALTGYSEPPKLYKLIMAPTHLRDKFIALIRREVKNAQEGKVAKIICKMNSFCDQEIMQEIYKASIAGVQVELIVRGICSLIPGIPGISENITIRSIVGKYLEHSRIYYFYNDGKESVYLSSADWMPRNLNRRVELMFPIEDPENKKKVLHILDIVLRDVVKARIKNMEKEYQRIDRRGRDVIDSQDYFEKEANRMSQRLLEVSEADLFRTRD